MYDHICSNFNHTHSVPHPHVLLHVDLLLIIVDVIVDVIVDIFQVVKFQKDQRIRLMKYKLQQVSYYYYYYYYYYYLFINYY